MKDLTTLLEQYRAVHIQPEVVPKTGTLFTIGLYPRRPFTPFLPQQYKGEHFGLVGWCEGYSIREVRDRTWALVTLPCVILVPLFITFPQECEVLTVTGPKEDPHTLLLQDTLATRIVTDLNMESDTGFTYRVELRASRSSVVK